MHFWIEKANWKTSSLDNQIITRNWNARSEGEQIRKHIR